ASRQSLKRREPSKAVVGGVEREQPADRANKNGARCVFRQRIDPASQSGKNRRHMNPILNRIVYPEELITAADPQSAPPLENHRRAQPPNAELQVEDGCFLRTDAHEPAFAKARPHDSTGVLDEAVQLT